MIVGTAGHIDHGKTTLVRALTGVDTDRLPEEQRRGITIELGYAFMDGPPGVERIGFVDVPGHERLVHTMLAGATGLHAALLLVAADDGVMPQTREHLAVLSLLGISRGAVVVTKCDRADAARVEVVKAEAAALLPGTALEGAPVFAVAAGDPSARAGLEPLRRWLLQEAAVHAQQRAAAEADGRAFRLAIDRVFTLDGVGTVATGTVHAGRARVGDELLLAPTPARAERLRVRSLHAQNRAVDEAVAGQRCAVGLAGVDKSALRRGQWLVGATAQLATTRLDAELRVWPGEARALRSGTPVHVHLGSVDLLGSVAVLDRGGQAVDTLPPGEHGRVQLVLQQPVGAWRGDRLVLRDASASRTLAGGRVLDPFAPTRHRRTSARLRELDATAQATPALRLAAALETAPQGLNLSRWLAAEGGIEPPVFDARALRAVDTEGQLWLLADHEAALHRATLLDALARFHAAEPEVLGPDAARLRRLAAPRLPEALWRALLVAAVADGAVQQRGAFVHRPEHGLRLSAVDERLAERFAPALAAAAFEGAWARDLARDHGESEALVRTTLARLAQRGELHQVVRDLYYAPATMQRLAALVLEVAEGADGVVTAARYRDATGLGRKRAIQILEHFDRVGLLRRVGDEHRLRRDSAWLDGSPVAEPA